jgi:hypothetical protein
MKVCQSRLSRMVALTVVVTLPLLGGAGLASAKTAKKTPAAKCAKHPKRVKCQAGGGSTGTGGTGPILEVTVVPNPLVETGQSEIHAVIEVETLPAYAGDAVDISADQTVSSCQRGSVFFDSVRSGREVASPDGITTVLDDDGNATVGLTGVNCAPGSDVIMADLDVAPYLTAVTTLITSPPAVTTEGLTGVPNDEVETGDTNGRSGNSDVYAVFYVETLPIYAEQQAEISSEQLQSRCGQGWWWFPGNGGTPTSGPGGPNGAVGGAQTTLDDDGNAVFLFKGASCATGTSQVVADVEAGDHPTYTFEYTILAPAVTI